MRANGPDLLLGRGRPGKPLSHSIFRPHDAARDGAFVLLLGGDCSILLGALLGLKQGRGPLGLVYLDGQADFVTPQESQTDSVASMDLALAVGRGDSVLARLSADGPLLRGFTRRRARADRFDRPPARSA